MPTTTTNYGFTKPSGGEAVNIATLNADLDSIDTRLKTNADAGGTEATRATAAEATKRQRFNTISTTKTASYSAAVWDSATYDTTSGAISQALPSSPTAGDEWEAFSAFNTTNNLLTVTGTGGPFTIYPGHGVTFRWNGSAWVERQDRKTKASLDREYSIANPVLSVTYNADGTVASTTENGTVTTFTYNTDGTVATETRGGVTRTFSYNADGTVAGAA